MKIRKNNKSCDFTARVSNPFPLQLSAYGRSKSQPSNSYSKRSRLGSLTASPRRYNVA
ncbi:hypothetical protein V6Z11_D12G126500 [Gossypium hirsutum]